MLLLVVEFERRFVSYRSPCRTFKNRAEKDRNDDG
jgi:hypothetical protein